MRKKKNTKQNQVAIVYYNSEFDQPEMKILDNREDALSHAIFLCYGILDHCDLNSIEHFCEHVLLGEFEEALSIFLVGTQGSIQIALESVEENTDHTYVQKESLIDAAKDIIKNVQHQKEIHLCDDCKKEQKKQVN